MSHRFIETQGGDHSWFFRVLGFGLSFRDHTYDPPGFSERIGYSKHWHWGPLCITPLTDYAIEIGRFSCGRSFRFRRTPELWSCPEEQILFAIYWGWFYVAI